MAHQRQELSDDFGNSVNFVLTTLDVPEFIQSMHATVRFICDGDTERAFTEQQLQHYGFIQ
jgi:hypothetical protein